MRLQKQKQCVNIKTKSLIITDISTYQVKFECDYWLQQIQKHRGDIVIKYRFQFGNEENFTHFKIKLRVT